MKLQTSGSCLGAVRLTSNLSLCRPCVYPSIYILDFPGGNLPKDELSTTQLWIWDKLKVWDIIFFLSRNPMSLHFLGGHLCFCLFGRTVQVCRSLFVPSSVSVSCLLFFVCVLLLFSLKIFGSMCFFLSCLCCGSLFPTCVCVSVSLSEVWSRESYYETLWKVEATVVNVSE